MLRYSIGLWIALLVGGCQSVNEQMRAAGYPPAYADGYQDGCSSGREAADVRVGDFRKNVPRYLAERQYETGWDDGFRQCQSTQASQESRDYQDGYWRERDRAWHQENARDTARALRHN
ncbi:hypothetical protein SJI00_18255 [Pseudomonas sp. RP23018S]|uniref:hypothetical protein n=1 Tax=Pseudomonas sp. RP23018S TaxID=3096037 RepID=UPI002ACA32DB|nr:hypothetical protein [Pseudomonas sp. RP23018S]MDZ5604715.1 hypothetical protein [Pseudomonas sp. RP23018S]